MYRFTCLHRDPVGYTCCLLESYNFGNSPISVSSLQAYMGYSNHCVILHQGDKAGPLKLYAPPYVLAPLKDKQSQLAESCGEKLEKSNVIFCGYCLSEDQRWLLATFTDQRGEMTEMCTVNIEIPNRYICLFSNNNQSFLASFL